MEKWSPKNLMFWKNRQTLDEEGFDPRDLETDKIPDNDLSCNKGNHLLRSLANSPVHQKHWAKKGNIFTRKPPSE